MKKLIIASVVAFALAVGAFAPSASAVTVAELMAQIAALQAQIAAMSGSTGGSSMSAGHVFNTDLTVGSTGSEVVALQQLLVSQGKLVMPAGVAMGYFGQLTKSGVAAWQAAVGLPATGFFGPLSRAKANASAVVVTPPPTTGGTVTPPATGSTDTGTSLSGGEGQLKNIDTLGEVSNEDIDEGQKDGKVLGVEVEAEDSDISIERVDVDFEHTSGTASDKLYKYVDSVSLWLGSKKLKTLDVDAASEDSDVYSFRFTGLGGVVREGSTANLYVAVSAVSNVDSSDTDAVWTVSIPTDGIRAVDAAGVSDTYVDSGDSISETFQVGASDTGEIDITESSSNPKAAITVVSDTVDTTGVKLLVLDFEAKSSDLKINDIPIGLAASNTVVADVVKTVKLMKGSTVLDSKSIPSTASTYYQVVFDDLDLKINEGDTTTLTVVADINKTGSTFGEGDAVYATTTGASAQYDIEDSNGDAVTTTDLVSGYQQTFYIDGIAVALHGSPTATMKYSPTSGSGKEVGTFTVSFDITAAGAAVYVDDTIFSTSSTGSAIQSTGTGFAYGTSSSNSRATSTSVTATGDSSNDVSGSYFKINKGQTRTFTLTVDLEATAAASNILYLRGINWATTTTISNYYTYNLSDFKTPALSLVVR